MANKEIMKLWKEFKSLPKQKQYSLGSRGVEIINEIHKLKIKEVIING